MNRVVRVLVVDDSAYIRKTITQMLGRSPFIEVVGTAMDGLEALEKVERLQPDVVTLDLMMPRMDGIAFLREQMARRPIPVVIVSIASETGEMALAALDAGAIDFVQKPTALATDQVFEIATELVEKVKAAAAVQMSKVIQVASLPTDESLRVAPRQRSGRVDAVVVGISTGGPQALRHLVPKLPAEFPVPVLIVMHMPVGYTELYAQRLSEISLLRVVEAHEGDVIRPGVVYLAQAGRHLTVKRAQNDMVIAHLDYRPFDAPHRPSVDVLFQSAAAVYKDRLLGVIMTGMGNDGLQGAAWIKAQGGLILTEAEESCIVYGMPRAVVEANLSDKAVPLGELARAIMEVVYGKDSGG